MHHVHGGSVHRYGIRRGVGQKTSDWLVIPLVAELHTGEAGIDSGMGVADWEKGFGTQLYWLTEVCRQVGYDVFHLAGIKHPGRIIQFE